MATPSEIAAWKRQYRKIFSVSLMGIDYIFRAVTFSEYDEAVALGAAEGEEELLRVALLEPLDVDFDSVPAGVVTSLADEILEISGLGSPQYARNLLEEHRVNVAQVRGLMKAFVLSVMPSYKEEELDDLTFDALAAKVALAEQIIQVQQAAFGVDNITIRLDLTDEEEEAQRQQEVAKKHGAKRKPGQATYDDPIAAQLQQALGG